MIVPRSKVKSGYCGSVAFLSFVVESDPLFPLTQPGSALSFLSVARRWCVTAHSRAQGPTHSGGHSDMHLGKQDYSS